MNIITPHSPASAVPALSVLVCTLVERRAKAEYLVSAIARQDALSCVEVVLCEDNREASVGEKRNAMVTAARGRYVAHVDDDDRIGDDYVLSITDAIATNPDCVGIEGQIEVEGQWRAFKHSIEFAGWYEAGGVFYRTPNHLNPIKREIALRAKFPEMRYGEDTIFSQRVKPFLKTEVRIKHPIYFYKPTHKAAL